MSKNTIEYFVSHQGFRKWVLETDEELSYYWQNWFYENPETLETANEAIEIIQNIKFRRYEIPAGQKEVLWNNIKNRVNKNTSSDVNWGFYLKIAAVILIVLSAGIFILVDKPQPVNVIVKSEMVEKHTRRGEKSTFQLPDGTLVKLNSESFIKFPNIFSDTSRIVFLEGEAYFEVAPDNNKPFKVYSGKMITQAVGTAFVVANIKGHDSVVIALTEGKVLVSAENERLALIPGQMASYISESNQLKKLSYIDEQLIAWKDNIIIFKDADWNNIKYELEKWFDIKLKNDSKQKTWKFNGRFENSSLENILKSICYSKNLTYEIKGKNVVIKEK